MTCSDASSELSKFLKEYGVHEVLSNALALKGLETVDDFAYAFPELPSLDPLQPHGSRTYHPNSARKRPRSWSTTLR